MFGQCCLSAKESDPSIIEFQTTVRGDDELVDVLGGVSIFITAIVMLIAPLWILAVLDSTSHKLGIITAFILVFLAVMIWATLAQPFELLATAAG